MPEPSPKAQASTRPVGTPTHEAMARFCRDCAHIESQSRPGEQQPHPREHGESEADDHDAAPRQHDVGEHLHSPRT